MHWDYAMTGDPGGRPHSIAHLMSKAGDRHFEEFKDHTLLKHLILRNYVSAWASKLFSWRQRVWFVDAFAGEGQDQKGNPGSPLIAAQIAESLLERHPDKRMQILAIEKDRARYDRLRAAMKPYTDRSPAVAHVRHGILKEYLGGFMRHVADDPALFFLDPFGVDGMLVDLLPTALSGPQNEVFALFSDVGAKRLHGVLVAEGRNPDEEVEKVLARPSLFPEYDAEDAARQRVDAERSAHALRTTQDPAERILTEALGPGTIDQVTAAPEDERRELLARIYMRRLHEAGAAYVLSLPVRDATNQRQYQLVYATKSGAGLSAMKVAMDSALRNAPLPGDSVEAIRAELQGNEGAVVRELGRHFAGREVRWTEGRDRGTADTVKRYLLERTAVFPMQFSEVKRRLAQEGWTTTKNRALYLQFPPATK